MARGLLFEHGMFAAILALILALAPPDGIAPQLVRAGGDAPTVVEVQRKAIEHARLDPAEITSWKKRARLSALLPKFQVEYARRTKYDVNVNVNDTVYVGSGGSAVGPDEGGYAENQNDDQNIGVKAVWDFSQAIFNPDLLAVSEEARLLSRERQSILAQVNANYAERIRAQGEIARLTALLKREPHPEKLRHDIFVKEVSLHEATAALDALTGGWFSERVRAQGAAGAATSGGGG